MKGLVHIYTGNGKGKTTAAIGLGIRAYGRGFKVLMVQFMKGADTGEIHALKLLEPGFELRRGKEIKKFTWHMDEKELNELKRDTGDQFFEAVKSVASGQWDMLIFDEILVSVSLGLLSVDDVADFLKNKPEKLEVVMTGRDAPAALIEIADYVSEIREIKHPFRKGIPARKGIES